MLVNTMRTSIVIDDELIEDTRCATGFKTKREVDELGLRTLLRLRQQDAVRRLRGKWRSERDPDATWEDGQS